MRSRSLNSEHEIACYVLGVDMAEINEEIQIRLAKDNAAAARALKWEAYFLHIADALPASAPPADVLSQICLSLGITDPGAEGQATSISHEGRPQQPASSGSPVAKRGKGLSKLHKYALAAALAVLLVLIVAVLWSGQRPGAGKEVQQTIELRAQ